MARWEPGTKERLQAAALELFDTRGFDVTTTADIAGAVGLTERTFFRHFADKREVLFSGQEYFQAGFLRGIVEAPADLGPLDAITCALDAAGDFFPDERRPHSRLRQRVIDENPALQERELLKMAGLSTLLARALRERGVTEPAATLAAETGKTVFGVAFSLWIAEGEERSLGEIEREVLGRLSAMAGAPRP